MDEIDRAKKQERFHRRISKGAQSDRRKEALSQTPLIIGGVRCCLDCREPIPEKRLQNRPESVRCVPCKGKYERKHPYVPPFANQKEMGYVRRG